MNLFDKAISSIGLVRKSEALPLALRSFEGAAMSRLTADFLEQSTEIDQDIRSGGRRLRNRARHLVVNNAFATRARELYIANVAGESGHIFQSDINMLVEDPETKAVYEESDEAKNAQIERIVEDFSKPENCTVTRRMSYAAVQRIAAGTKFTDGEMFIRRVWSTEAKYGFRLQLIPAEVIAEELSAVLDNGNVIKMGVELDQWNQPVAYWAYKSSAQTQVWGPQYRDHVVRIPADDMIHWYDPRFAVQTRGYSRLAPVMLQLHWIRGYGDATVLNAKISASKLGLLSDVDPENPTGEIRGTGKDVQGNTTISAKPGSFQYIGAKKLWQWDPKYPMGEHEMFMRQSIREIAAGVSESYSALSGDYSQHNFSSQRGEAENIRRNYMGEQNSMVQTLNNRVFGWIIEGAIMKGILKLAKYQEKENVMKPCWMPPRWDYINPVDESNATRSDLEALIVSPFEVAARKGRRYEDVLRDTRTARKLEQKYGVAPVYGKTGNVSTETPATAPAPAPAQSQPIAE